MYLINKKVNYRKLYVNSNSKIYKRGLKWYLSYLYARRYFTNFSAELLKVSLYWWGIYGFFVFPVVSYIYFWPAFLYFKQMVKFMCICAYLGCYFEVHAWRHGIFYTIDFYFMYASFKCIDYLEHLESLWIHRK